MLIKLRKAQSTAEYAVIIGVVVAAALAMQVYIKRGIQARSKAGMDAFTTPTGPITVAGQTTTFDNLAQYEPYYIESNYETYSGSKTDINVGNDYMTNMNFQEVSGRGAGGYQVQHGYTATRQNIENALWQ